MELNSLCDPTSKTSIVSTNLITLNDNVKEVTVEQVLTCAHIKNSRPYICVDIPNALELEETNEIVVMKRLGSSSDVKNLKDTLNEWHRRLLHPGINKTYYTLRSIAINVKQSLIEEVGRECDVCKKRNITNKKVVDDNILFNVGEAENQV